MSDDFLSRIGKISIDLLKCDRANVSSRGEDYYVIESIGADGQRSTLPPVWIDPHSTDDQIRAKLNTEFHQAFNPDSAADDLSVPDLQTEGKVR